jgi:hypothetical protein
MDIKKKLTANLQLVITFATVIGLGIGIINFFILTTVTPLEKRVVALETFQTTSAPVFADFIEVKTKVDIMFLDIKDIKNYLNIR